MKFTISDMFSDHMVVRHSQSNPIWGTAPAHSQVTATYINKSASCVADEKGRWLLWLDFPNPGICGTLEIVCAGETIKLADVITGVVFLCSGQSNMEQPLMCAENGAYWIERANKNNIRLKSIPHCTSPDFYPSWHFYPCTTQYTSWVCASFDRVATFSAIAIIFGVKLSESLGIPVGLINCSWGGTKIQCWLPTKQLLSYPDTVADLIRYETLRNKLGETAHTALREYTSSVLATLSRNPDFIMKNLQNPLSYLEDDKHIFYPPEGCDESPEKPGVLYDNMIARVAPYGLNGVLWYQGEANTSTSEAKRYAVLFGRLLTSWRKAFQNNDLPFLTCQLASFDASIYANMEAWYALREQQQLCTELYKNVSLAILLDAGMKHNIHPLNKEIVADRLCRLALEDLFSIPSHAHASKIISHVCISNGLELHFDKPIIVNEGTKPLLINQITGKPQECILKHPNSTVLQLFARESEMIIKGAIYAQENWLIPSLYSDNNNPIAPFRIELN